MKSPHMQPKILHWIAKDDRTEATKPYSSTWNTAHNTGMMNGESTCSSGGATNCKGRGRQAGRTEASDVLISSRIDA